MRARPSTAADRRGRFGEPQGLRGRAGLHFLALRPLKPAQVSQSAKKSNHGDDNSPIVF